MTILTMTEDVKHYANAEQFLQNQATALVNFVEGFALGIHLYSDDYRNKIKHAAEQVIYVLENDATNNDPQNLLAIVKRARDIAITNDNNTADEVLALAEKFLDLRIEHSHNLRYEAEKLIAVSKL